MSINPQKPKLTEASCLFLPGLPRRTARRDKQAGRRALYQKPQSAPRTPLSHASSSRAHSLVASRLWRHAPSLHASASFGISSVRCRSVTILYTKNRGVWLPMPSQATSCLAHGLSLRLSPSASLWHRLSVGFGRVSPPFHSGGTLPRLLPLPPLLPQHRTLCKQPSSYLL